MTKDPFDRIIQLFNIGQVIFTLLLMVFAVQQAVRDGEGSTASWVAGVVLAALVAFFSLAVNKGFQWWERLSEWLEGKFKVYTSLRRFIIFISVASAPILVYWAISRIESSITFKGLIVVFFGIILPAALVSMAMDDKLVEKSPIAKYISRETFTHDPQAAVAKAFTVVEHKLKDKLGTQAVKSSGQLIGAAYGGEKSRLVLIIDGQDHTAHMRDLMSGVFALLRNPRHHKLVDDDEHTASALYQLAGVLLNLIEKSKARK